MNEDFHDNTEASGMAHSKAYEQQRLVSQCQLQLQLQLRAPAARGWKPFIP